jgi:hypothetical protein
MKRLTAIILTGVMLLGLTACSDGDKKSGNGAGEPTEIVIKQTDEAAETTKEAEETEEEADDELFREWPHRIAGVPTEGIYIDVPYWHEIEMGYTSLFILSGVEYVAVSWTPDYRDDESIISSLSTVHEKAFEKFIAGVDSYTKVKGLTATTESTETINGVEVYRYEGVLNVENKALEEIYTIGYSFVFEGMPINVIGVILDEEQDPEMIDELRTIVDAMIPTIRTTEDK